MKAMINAKKQHTEAMEKTKEAPYKSQK